MKRNRLYLALGLMLVLVIAASTGSFTQAAQSSVSQSDAALLATAAPTTAATEVTVNAANFSLCMAPTPTPGGTVAPTEAPAATMPATAAAVAPATMAATKAGTKAATKAPTKTPVPTATKVPPTATPIPKGKKPASAGLVLAFNAAMVRANSLKCVSVASTTAGGPADVAGIKAGDFVIGFGQDEIKDAQDFYDHVAKYLSGDKVQITVERDGAAQTLSVQLGLNPYASAK